MLERHGRHEYRFHGDADFETALQRLIDEAKVGDSTQEYYKLKGIPTYDQLFSLKKVLGLPFEFGLYDNAHDVYLIRGTNETVGGGLIENMSDNSLWLHVHPESEPPSPQDAVIATLNSSSTHIVFIEDGLIEYTGLKKIKAIPGGNKWTFNDIMRYLIHSNWDRLNDINQWPEILKEHGITQRFYRWGTEAKEYWEKIIKSR